MSSPNRPISITSQHRTGETTMITQPPRHKLSRLAVASAFLLTGLAGTAQATLAGSPLDDAGGPDGGGAVAEGPIFLEELGLVSTNDPAEPITGHTRLDGPTLVGSGPEREIVANSVNQQVAGRLDETERSTELAALSPQASDAIAQAPTEARFGQPF